MFCDCASAKPFNKIIQKPSDKLIFIVKRLALSEISKLFVIMASDISCGDCFNLSNSVAAKLEGLKLSFQFNR